MAIEKIVHFRIPLALPIRHVIPPLAALFGVEIKVPPAMDIEIGVYKVKGVGFHDIRFVKPFDYLPSTNMTALGHLEVCIPFTDLCLKLPAPVFLTTVTREKITLLSFASEAVVTFAAYAPRKETAGPSRPHEAG